jgi:hypothetical protein
VRKLKGRWQSPGSVELAWNGRSEGGQVVLPGGYVVHVEARNRLGVVALARPVTVKRGR